jgi:hypothetical protein
MPQPTPPKVSRYLPIWNKLKTDKVCKITAPIIYHKTIIKMIKNRRDKDLAYRFTQSELRIHEQIKVSVIGTVITFKLVRRLTLQDL